MTIDRKGLTEGRSKLWIVVLSLAAASAVYVIVARFVAPTALEASGAYEGGFRVADFLMETELIEAYWSGEIDSPYDPAGQALVLESLGSDGQVAAAFAMNPITLVLLGPFAMMARADFIVAYAGWVALSFGIFLLMLLLVYARIDRDGVGLRALFVTGVLLIVGSRVGWRSFALADTAPVAVAGLLLITLVVSSRDRRHQSRRLLLALAYLFVLWKIQYVGLATALHFLLGPRREAMVYGAAATLVALGIPTVFDPRLLPEFVGQVIHYTGSGFSDGLARIGQSAEGGSGVTLRSTLTTIVGYEASRAATLFMFLGSGLVLLVLDLRGGKRRAPRESQDASMEARSAVVRALLLLSVFLVLMPYLGRYDELFLVVCVSLPCLFTHRLQSVWLASIGCIALVVAGQLPAPGKGDPAHAILVAKVVALGALLALLAGGAQTRSMSVADWKSGSMDSPIPE